MFKDKKVLITGGGGFIGSHLVKKLIELNADICVVKRNTRIPWRLEKEIDRIQKMITIDITDHVINQVILQYKPDFIFHLAAYGVDSKEKDYYLALNTNVIGIVNIMNAAIKAGCKKIINIGTCAEYGDVRKDITENICLNPVNIYGSTKAAATIIAHQMAKEADIDIVTLRLFGVFGEAEDRHKIFCHTILELLEGKDVELTSCAQFRDYCYVADVIRAIILATQNNIVKNEIFNIGYGKAFPLKYYIDLIHQKIGSNQKLLYGAIENRKNELWFPKPDISKIKTILGWEPIYPLEEGIANTIEWYKENRQYYT